MSIVSEAIELLRSALASAEPLNVEDVRVGVFYTGVKVSGHAGIAFTPRDLSDSVCCPKTAADMPAVGRMRGQSAWTISQYATTRVPLKRSVGIATISALSSLLLDRSGFPEYRVVHGADALEAVSVGPEDRVAMVGSFIPFIKALKGRVRDLRIIDKHPQALKEAELPLWCPPQEAPSALSAADIAIISGSALVEGGLEELLELCRGCREVVLAGPTASIHPEPLFRRGVTAMAGVAVKDPDGLMEIVGEGGSGYFFESAAEKVVIVKETGRVAAAPAK